MQSRPPGPAQPTPQPPGDVSPAWPATPAGSPAHLGPYRLLSVLGEGGMGTVWMAEDEHLGRKAAVKVMRPELARDDGGRQRFLREARAMAALRSDHVVTVYGVGEEGGVPYVAMELLPGKPLDQWLERHPRLKIAAVVQIGREAAQGLAAAHAKGLVHRDVKPSNLWLEAPTGRVKLLDFGLARQVQDTGLTRTGQWLGTPAYMAPEQWHGKNIDCRCDLYSLGVILYQMCTGQVPFPGSHLEIAAALATGNPPDVRELNPEVPTVLAALVHRMLAKDPNGRPASAKEVVEELQRLSGAVRGTMAPAEPSPSLTRLSPSTSTKSRTAREESPRETITSPGGPETELAMRIRRIRFDEAMHELAEAHAEFSTVKPPNWRRFWLFMSICFTAVLLGGFCAAFFADAQDAIPARTIILGMLLVAGALFFWSLVAFS